MIPVAQKDNLVPINRAYHLCGIMDDLPVSAEAIIYKH